METPFGLVVELAGGGLLDLPPTLALLDEAPPGDYRLRSAGEIVVDPDLLSVGYDQVTSGAVDLVRAANVVQIAGGSSAPVFRVLV